MLIAAALLSAPALLLGGSASRLPVSRACVFALASPETGKFLRHNELSPGCGPLGVLCAGFNEDQLEMIAGTIEGVFDSPEDQPLSHIPIVALAQGDTRLRLRDVLANIRDRDSVLPAQPMRLETPLVLLSGFNTVQTSLAVRSLRSLNLRSSSQSSGQGWRWPWDNAVDKTPEGEGSAPMFAAVVPNALDKPLRVLCEELEGDHRENAR